MFVDGNESIQREKFIIEKMFVVDSKSLKRGWNKKHNWKGWHAFISTGEEAGGLGPDVIRPQTGLGR